MRTTLPVSVHLRTRKTKEGLESLYLDILEDGKRRKESLHMYYLAGKDRATRLRNEETRRIAEIKMREMEDELNSIADGFEREGSGLDMEFFDFYTQCMEKHRNSNTYNSWKNSYNHLLTYLKDQHIQMKRISPKIVEGYKEYLLNEASDSRSYKEDAKGLSTNSADLYFMKLVTCMREAKTLHYIKRDPTEGIRRIGHKPGTRGHLDAQEVKALINTDCEREIVKRMFLFCCVTGIRFIDASELTWDKVYKKKDVYYINIRQIKTDVDVEVPLNDMAMSILGEIKETGKVFEDIPSLPCVNASLLRWCEAAGINKHITFHCSRHTFACLTLLATGNLYTTSKLLGHTNIKTTEIYAKIMDETKEKAVNALNNLL